MDKIIDMNVSEMAGLSFECSCGKKHSVDIRKIIIGDDLAGKVAGIAGDFRGGKIFVLADNNTYSICGSNIEKLLAASGFDVKSHVFKTNHPLVPDEKAVGRLLIEIGEDVSFIVAVGAGSINDLARIISSRLKIPYMIFGTAPSMDGYASTVSPLIIDGFKKTYEAVYPYAILADVEIMKCAPQEMVCAGFGDILGKYTALTDWKLSKTVNGEYYCETSVKLIENAIKKCIDNIQGIVNRDGGAITYLIEALILSGVAMGLVGNSRPASGAEHHLAHYWEMDALAKGIDHPLHGNSVGVGTVVISYIYEMLRDKLEKGINPPDPETVRSLLRGVGANDNPVGLGIKKEVFRSSILHAMEIRPRYTVFHQAQKIGLLEAAADELTWKFYGA